MITINKKWLKKSWIVVGVIGLIVSQTGCEALNKLVDQDTDSETATTTAVSEPKPAPVIEPFYEQPSNWRPILPHELDAHFEETEAVLKLLRYARRLKELTPQELDQEYQGLSQVEHQERSIAQQMQMALLLSTQGASFRDSEQAKKILSSVINAEIKRGVVLREYAYNLFVTLEQIEKAEQQNAVLRKKLKKETEERELLEQKLEALKSIEESITQRQNNPESKPDSNSQSDSQSNPQNSTEDQPVSKPKETAP